jgi:hypothetical protein
MKRLKKWLLRYRIEFFHEKGAAADAAAHKLFHGKHFYFHRPLGYNPSAVMRWIAATTRVLSAA